MSANDGRDRRERPRDGASHAPALGGANLNPFGDLHTLQHLSARLARSLRGVFEPLLRQRSAHLGRAARASSASPITAPSAPRR